MFDGHHDGSDKTQSATLHGKTSRSNGCWMLDVGWMQDNYLSSNGWAEAEKTSARACGGVRGRSLFPQLPRG